MKSDNYWIIGPAVSLLKTKLTNIYPYRFLLRKLVQREISLYYKQTLLGPIWFVLQPLLSTFIFVFCFGKLAGLSTDSIPKPLFYLSGIIIWNFFAECINKTANVFKDNLQLFSKIYFPRILVPLATIIAIMVRMAIQLCLFAFLIFFYELFGYTINLSAALLLIPVLLLQIAALGLGIGLIVSSVTTRYRDFSFLVAFAIQLLMYASSVIFPLSMAPAELIGLIQINPMSSIVEGFRSACFGKGVYSAGSFLYTTTCSLTVLNSGVIIFKKTQQNFVDII